MPNVADWIGGMSVTAPWVLSVHCGRQWPHNELQYHQLIDTSQLLTSRLLLIMTLTHVSIAIATTCIFTFTWLPTPGLPLHTWLTFTHLNYFYTPGLPLYTSITFTHLSYLYTPRLPLHTRLTFTHLGYLYTPGLPLSYVELRVECYCLFSFTRRLNVVQSVWVCCVKCYNVTAQQCS